MSQFLLGFDQVVALTQQTINTQFLLMYLNGTISSKIADPADADSKGGIFGTIKAPTIEISLPGRIDPGQVTFNINLDKAQARYSDPAGAAPASVDVSGWRIAVTVDLRRLALPDPSVRLGEATQKQIDGLSGDIYTMYSVLLDLDNADVETAQIFDAAGTLNQDDRLAGLVADVLLRLRAEGNPYVVTVLPTVSQARDTGLEALRPTSVTYNTHLYGNAAAQSPFNTFNILIMNEDHAPPAFDGQPPAFDRNLAPESQAVHGRFYLSKSQFAAAYVEALVLKKLAQAMGGQAEFKPAGGDTWTYDWTWTNDPDEHGTKLGGVWFKETRRNRCTLQLDAGASTSAKVVLSGTGYFEENVDTYEQYIVFVHTNNVNYRRPFSFSIALEAGVDGKIGATVDIRKGAAQDSTWTLWGSDPNIARQNLDRIAQSVGSLASDEMTSMLVAATDLFDGLKSAIILPGASQYLFKNFCFAPSGDLQLDIVIDD